MGQCETAAEKRNQYAHAVVMDSMSANTGDVTKAVMLAGKVQKTMRGTKTLVQDMMDMARTIQDFASEGASLLMSLRAASAELTKRKLENQSSTSALTDAAVGE